MILTETYIAISVILALILFYVMYRIGRMSKNSDLIKLIEDLDARCRQLQEMVDGNADTRKRTIRAHSIREGKLQADLKFHQDAHLKISDELNKSKTQVEHYKNLFQEQDKLVAQMKEIEDTNVKDN